MLIEAKSPVLIVGPEVTRSDAQREVIKLAEQLSIPVAQGEALFDDFPTNHPLFLGDYRWPLRYPNSIDLVLCLGAKMPYQDAMIPSSARVVHISIDPGLIGRVVPTDLGIVADAKEAAADLVTAIDGIATKARLSEMRSSRLAATKAYTEKLRAGRARGAQARWNNKPLSWERMAGELNQQLEKDAIIVPELAQVSWLGSAENTALTQFAFAPGEKDQDRQNDRFCSRLGRRRRYRGEAGAA